MEECRCKSRGWGRREFAAPRGLGPGRWRGLPVPVGPMRILTHDPAPGMSTLGVGRQPCRVGGGHRTGSRSSSATSWLCDQGQVILAPDPLSSFILEFLACLNCGFGSPGRGQGLSGCAYHLHHPGVLHRSHCHPLRVPSDPRPSQRSEYFHPSLGL